MASLRIDYLGAGMGFAATALMTEHRLRGHQVRRCRDVDDISTSTPPDVVVHPAFDRTEQGVIGMWSLAARLPEHVLLAPGLRLGPAHAMLVHHVCRGNCHPKVMFHLLDGEPLLAGEMVETLETAAEKPPEISSFVPLPPELQLTCDADLGEIMAERERWGRLLYVAAARRDWSGWGDLTRLLNVGDGVVRNVNGELGNRLKEVGIIPWELRWTAPVFSRFVVEYRSFIIGFGQHRLGYEPPIDPLWRSYPPWSPPGEGDQRSEPTGRQARR